MFPGIYFPRNIPLLEKNIKDMLVRKNNKLNIFLASVIEIWIIFFFWVMCANNIMLKML